MLRKGDIGMDTVVKLLVTLAVILVVVGIIMLASGKTTDIVTQIKDMLRFG